MALSSSQSALLAETCENMNVAANTCREVLEMLRNLGNTGVVDIATHNNASTPHANASNLFHVDTSGVAYLGQKGWTGFSAWSDYYSYRVAPDTSHKGYNVYSMKAINGTTTDPAPKIANYLAVTDSSGTQINFSDAVSSGVSRNVAFGTWENQCLALDKTATASISAIAGTLRDTDGGLGNACFRLKMSDSASNQSVICYEINSTSIIPWGGITASLGDSGLPFDTAYLRTAATVTSDRREKSGISALGSEAVDFIKALRPVQYTVKNGRQHILETDEGGYPTEIETVPGTRRHWGLIAQEVKEALSTAGYEDAAVWCLADKNDPDSKQALRYEELIAPMIKVIQQQQERIEALERKVA